MTKKSSNLIVFIAVSAFSILITQNLSAADTTETYDVGATDAEFYVGLDGIGHGKYNKTIYSDTILGYGLTSKLSFHLGSTLSANEYFGDGNADLHTGLYGTPVDTDHFDMDLFLEIALEGMSDFQVIPSLELNYDYKPDVALWGLYLRAGTPLYGRESEDSTPENPKHEIATTIETTLGTYLTLNENHQLLLEYDMTFLPSPVEDEQSVSVGGLALGYNVIVHDAIELINQVYVDIPQDEENFGVGFMTGFIATLPTGSDS